MRREKDENEDSLTFNKTDGSPLTSKNVSTDGQRDKAIAWLQASDATDNSVAMAPKKSPYTRQH